MTLVMKFGGTSMGDAAAIKSSASLVKEASKAWPSLVVVVSAMSGITDLLTAGARAAADDESSAFHESSSKLRAFHLEAVSRLIGDGTAADRLIDEIQVTVSRFESLGGAVLMLGELTPRALDAITAIGERLSARILAAYLSDQGLPAEAVDATELIVTDDSFQGAIPIAAETAAKTARRLRPLFESGVVPVVTGFIGATRSGLTTTLGRGGSDYSAALLGQALNANEVWIWTDVDGVMSADPRLVPGAQTIEKLSYREMAELAYYGAKVLHPKAVRPVVESGIPLRVKNSFNPGAAGTVIVSESSPGNGDVKAVTAARKLGLIVVEGKGMMGVPGIAARTFAAVARDGVNVLLISQASSEQSICFAIPDKATEGVMQSLANEFDREIARKDIDRVWAHSPVSIVTAVGSGIRSTSGVAGRIFSALGESSVNIMAIAQGSSECSISLVVDENDTAAAEMAIHKIIAASSLSSQS